MHRFRSVTALLLAVFLLLSLAACGGTGSGTGTKPNILPEPDDTDNGYGDLSLPIIIPDSEPELILNIVPSPSLSGADAVETFGFSAAGTVLEARSSFGGGVSFGGLNEKGFRLWEPKNPDLWAVDPGKQIPDGFPTLVLPVGTEIEFINCTDHDVVTSNFVNCYTGESLGADLPTVRGEYILMVTVNVPRPSAIEPLPAVGAVFGDWYYFVVVSFTGEGSAEVTTETEEEP